VTTNSASGLINFIDQTSSNYPARYYRMIQ